MQLGPDWSEQTTAECFEETFGHIWSGPGLYTKGGDFAIVVPCPPEHEVDARNIWAVEQPPGTLYMVHVYNCRWEHTVLGQLFCIPSREVR
jgi:hypothetical protein